MEKSIVSKKNIMAKVLSNRRVSHDTMIMVTSIDNSYFGALPGQFLMIRTAEQEAVDPLLRRPFGVLKSQGKVEVLYRVVGRGTDWLSKKQPGSYVELMGPLGNGFELDRFNKKELILVAGGIGIAPVYALAEHLASLKTHENITLFYGAREKTDLFMLDSLRKMGVNLHLATEDGSSLYKGLVTELLEEKIVSDKLGGIVVTCGPYGMMKSVYNIAARHRLSCYASLDCRMACGYGVCSGCVVKIRSGESFVYKKVCKDGPVFNGEMLLWN